LLAPRGRERGVRRYRLRADRRRAAARRVPVAAAGDDRGRGRAAGGAVRAGARGGDHHVAGPCRRRPGFTGGTAGLVGAAAAGAAATAGLLYGLLAGLGPAESLELAACTAAARVSGTAGRSPL